MTRGTYHVTDVSNASRTLLFDLETGDWSDELCELFGVPRDALPELVPNWGEIARHRPEVVPRAVPADRRARRRPAVGALRPDLLRRGRLEVHLRHRVVRAHQHRLDASSAPTRCWPRPRGAPPTATLTYASEGSIFVTGAAVQWLRDGLQIVGSAAESRGGRVDGGRQRRRRLRARADRARRAALGPAGPRPDRRPDPRHHPRAHRPRDAGGDRLRGARRARRDAAALRRCASTAAPPPTTCCASCRPTPSAYPSSGRRSSRPPASARRSSPASAPGSGRPPTTCATPGPWTAASSPTSDRAAADAAHARWSRAVELAKGWAD